MRVITEPTVLAEGEDSEAILSDMSITEGSSSLKESKEMLTKVLQQAFDEGRKYEARKTSGEIPPDPEAAHIYTGDPLLTKVEQGDSPVPELSDLNDIMEEGPDNPIERFRYDQTPSSEGNVMLWESQLQEALKYAARRFTG